MIFSYDELPAAFSKVVVLMILFAGVHESSTHSMAPFITFSMRKTKLLDNALVHIKRSK